MEAPRQWRLHHRKGFPVLYHMQAARPRPVHLRRMALCKQLHHHNLLEVVRRILLRHMIPVITQIQIQTRASKGPGTSSLSGFVSLVDGTTMTDTEIFAGFVLCVAYFNWIPRSFSFWCFSVSPLPIMPVLISITRVDLFHDF